MGKLIEGAQVPVLLGETLAETRRLMARHSELAKELRELLARASDPTVNTPVSPAPARKQPSAARRRRTPLRVRNQRLLERPPPPVPFGLLVNFEEAELLELLRLLDPQQRATIERLLATLVSQPEPNSSDPQPDLP